MTRLTVVLALSAASSVALAETQAEIAARDNEEGKELMFAGNYKDASVKFHDAVARVPEAKYFFNLCTSLFQEGKFGEAMVACKSAEKNSPDDGLKGKIGKLEDKIHDTAVQQGVPLDPTGGGGDQPTPPDPNTPPVTPDPNTTGQNPTNPTNPTNPAMPINPAAPGPQPQYAVGRPPPQALFQAAAPEHTYTWTLGIDFYGGAAHIGQSNVYGTAATGFRVKADYMIMPRTHVGVEGYLQYTNLTQGSMDLSGVGALSIVDAGVGIYKHFCPRRGRLCFTPLGGIELAFLDPNQDQASSDQTFNYAAIGIRGEANLSFAFGAQRQAVLQAMLGVNYYTPVFAAPSDPGMSAADVGLDAGGPAVYLGVGFTWRFNTPFGQAPFITLE